MSVCLSSPVSVALTVCHATSESRPYTFIEVLALTGSVLSVWLCAVLTARLTHLSLCLSFPNSLSVSSMFVDPTQCQSRASASFSGCLYVSISLSPISDMACFAGSWYSYITLHLPLHLPSPESYTCKQTGDIRLLMKRDRGFFHLKLSLQSSSFIFRKSRFDKLLLPLTRSVEKASVWRLCRLTFCGHGSSPCCILHQLLAAVHRSFLIITHLLFNSIFTHHESQQ